jgi:microcystin-dependent protein
MDEYIGVIKMFIGDWAPDGYLMCQGQELQIGQNQALFALIGTRYGGDGVRTFKLPDLRSRFPMGMGQGLGLTQRNLGAFGGVENVTLIPDQIPAHNHALNGINGSGDSTLIKDNYLTNSVGNNFYGVKSPVEKTISMNAASIGHSGGGQAHTNMPPFITVNFIICVNGLFPPRQ